MRRIFPRLMALLALAMLFAGAVAAVALPGPQHMLCPTCHGLKRVSDNVYVEPVIAERQQRNIIRAVERGRKRTRAFFGELRSRPRIVICRSARCAAIFGSKGARGVAYGWHAILLGRSRILDVIAAHEFTHIELHWRMGLAGWLRGTVPAWFDEGLATLISADPRFRRDADADDVRDIMEIHSYLGQWGRHARRVGWRTAYGAAVTRVRRLERKIGRDGLRKFVDRLVRDGRIRRLLREASIEPAK